MTVNYTSWPTYAADSQYVTLNVLVGDNAAVAQVSYQGKVYSGSSKRHPGDPRDESIARDLAVGRALQNLGKALADAANKRSVKGH